MIDRSIPDSSNPATQSSGAAEAPGSDLSIAVSPSTTATPARPLVRFYMTSDLRAATGLTRSHLDFYLREGVIVPTARTESGYLLFDETELSTLRQVIIWRQDGVGIRDIRARLSREADETATPGVATQPND
ncbi:MAG TPA: MerR family transcriptional regulator [Thermomicrobiales bacterium]|nr:MerR family transcriptional regulator [Thermomicrobiales bacterium]